MRKQRNQNWFSRLVPTAKCYSILASIAEIDRKMSGVYGENFMSDGVVREWCRKLNDGRVDIDNEGGQKLKSVAKKGWLNELTKQLNTIRDLPVEVCCNLETPRLKFLYSMSPKDVV